MEDKKFRVITDKDENGNPVRKLVPYDEVPEPECHMYGNYVLVDEDHIQAAKDELLVSLFETIKEIAKNDKFWIVKQNEGNKYSVAWKIDFPQMYTE